MTSLARAELTLLVRSKGTLFAAVIIPFILPLSVHSATKTMDLESAGLSVGTFLLPSAIGMALVFAVYMALTAIYVARREELVLKRLRVGELRDLEILGGSALPAVTIALLQTVLLTVGFYALLDVEAPGAPHLAVLGLLLGIVLCAAAGAVTAAFSQSVESAQVTVMPMMMVSLLGSGITFPLELLPDNLARIGELLPLSGPITLLRGGMTGDLSGGETLTALVTAGVWTALSLYGVRRWFRWEPRR
ncbi:ABC transporter permease [Streptomyces sp. NPDC002490]|uniref:ABC transporter permease n=1 Tax=Streptomyces sp. NPDC002490 TaxID=3154416 RepID=UPI00331F7E08